MRALILSFLLVLASTAGLAAHEHHAPHKGSLQVFGEEFAHLELVLDAAGGTLTAYALDGEAEKPQRLAQKEIVLFLRLKPKAEPVAVVLKAVPNILSGETVGDSSQFEGWAPGLKGCKAFTGTAGRVRLRGRLFKGVKIKYPEGNES